MFDQRRPIIVDMAQVKARGLLANQGLEVDLGLGVPAWAFRRGARLHIRILKIDPAIGLDAYYGDEKLWNKCEVDIVYRQLHFGKRPYFVCPLTRLDCFKLIIYEDIICAKSKYNGGFSQAALKFYEARRKLLKEDGSLRMAPSERERLLKTVLRHPERYMSDRALLGLLERTRRSDRRRHQKWEWESRALSTTKGLDCGRGLGQDLFYANYVARDASWLASIPPPALPEAAAREGIEHFPELDIKILLDRGWFDRDDVQARSLGWPDYATGERTVYMFVDGRADGRTDGMPQLLFAFRDFKSDQIYWQRMRLLPGPNSKKPRYFLCPQTHARCELLYLRNGVFASAQAHNLRKPKNWQLERTANAAEGT